MVQKLKKSATPAISSSRHDAFVAAKAFSIHILGKDQLQLARAFAVDGRDFDHVDWESGETGAPALQGAVTRLDCHHYAAHEAGELGAVD